MSLENVIFVLTFFSQGFIIKKRFKKDALTIHESIFFLFPKDISGTESIPLIYIQRQKER